MENKKNGVALVSLIVTVIVIALLATIIIMNIRDENLVLRAEWVVSETRIKEIEYAITQINSDYQLLSQRDDVIRSMSLKEYILESLRENYGLTEEEESYITIDENGYLSINK